MESLRLFMVSIFTQNFEYTLIECLSQTGLDPAGPLFTSPKIVPLNRRLNSGDAQYVECLHTNRRNFGTNEVCGHSDFYANMGFVQPGCRDDACSHERAPYLFESSLHPKNKFLGRLCEDDLKSIENKCSTKVTQFGIHGQRSLGKFYFRTSECYPYIYRS